MAAPYIHDAKVTVRLDESPDRVIELEQYRATWLFQPVGGLHVQRELRRTSDACFLKLPGNRLEQLLGPSSLAAHLLVLFEHRGELVLRHALARESNPSFQIE